MYTNEYDFHATFNSLLASDGLIIYHIAGNFRKQKFSKKIAAVKFWKLIFGNYVAIACAWAARMLGSYII